MKFKINTIYNKKLYNEKYNNNNNYYKILGLFREFRESNNNEHLEFINDLYKNLLISKDFWEDIFDYYYILEDQ